MAAVVILSATPIHLFIYFNEKPIPPKEQKNSSFLYEIIMHNMVTPLSEWITHEKTNIFHFPLALSKTTVQISIILKAACLLSKIYVYLPFPHWNENKTCGY